MNIFKRMWYAMFPKSEKPKKLPAKNPHVPGSGQRFTGEQVRAARTQVRDEGLDISSPFHPLNPLNPISPVSVWNHTHTEPTTRTETTSPDPEPTRSRDSGSTYSSSFDTPSYSSSFDSGSSSSYDSGSSSSSSDW